MVHGCRSLFESGTIQPTMEFFCSQLILHHSQHSDALYTLCMVFIHDVLKSPSFKGTLGALDLRASASQVRPI